MVTKGQKREIKKRMKAIKRAKKNGKPRRIVQRRVKELTDYLQQQGIADLSEDE